jgi:hypothetical protein
MVRRGLLGRPLSYGYSRTTFRQMLGRLIVIGLVCLAQTILVILYFVAAEGSSAPAPEGLALATGIAMLLASAMLGWLGKGLGRPWMAVWGIVAAFPAFIWLLWIVKREDRLYSAEWSRFWRDSGDS